MNRRYLYRLLSLMLILPPLAIQAQRLTGYEYWFDGNVGRRVSKSLSGHDTEIETSIATQHLSSGLHTLHMRFKQSGGEYDYSPVTSQLFFKHNADEGGKIEYWFDNDVNNSATVSLPSGVTEDTVDVALNMTDALKFPLGFHQLNIRVATEGKSLSNIYTSHVLKMPSGEINAIEYWVDDQFDKRKMVEGHVASSDEKAYIFTNPFDLSGVPSGPHRIYYRPASKDGAACGAVSVASVVVGGGTPSKIEYWFDGNVASSATVDLPTTALSDTVDIALAMSNNKTFPLGMHQMSMRLISKDREQSPTYSARVLKKATGNPDVLEYWVDDWVDEKHVAHPKTLAGLSASSGDNAYIFNNSFDLSSVSEGFHRLYYRATSANGNASTAVSMTPVMVKSKYHVSSGNVKMKKFSIAIDNEEPALFSFNHSESLVDLEHTLDVRHLSKGNYTLNLKMTNSVGASVSLQQPFTVEERKPEPVVSLTAYEKSGLVHIRFNSIPSDNGFRIYRVDANGTSKILKNEKVGRYPFVISYTDAHSLKGNYKYYAEILYTDIDGTIKKTRSNEVNITVKSADTKLGYIEGEICYNGKRNVGFKSNIRFTYNDVVVRSNEDGIFRLDKIPVGEVVSVMLTENDYYISTPATVTIVKGRNYVHLDAIPKNDCTLNNQIDFGNLIFDDKLTWEPGAYFKLPLRNTSHEVWNGKICIKAIPKRYDTQEEPITPYDGIKIGEDAQVLPGSIASVSSKLPFLRLKNFQTFESESFQLVYNKAKEIVVPLTGFVNDGPKEMFNFYVYCVKPNGSMSLVMPNNSFVSTQSNPIEYEIEGGSNTNYDEIFLTNLIVYLCTTVKELDKIFLGGASKVLNYGKERLEYDYYMLTHATEENVLADEGMQEVVYDMIKKCDEYSSEVKSFRDAISTIIKPYETWESVKKNIEAIKKCSDDIASMNDYEKAIYLSQKIIELANNTVPISSVMKTYLDITQKTINNVLSLGWAYNEPNIPQDMYNNKLKVKIQIKGNRDWVNFLSSGSNMIDKVLVKGWNNTENDIVEATFRNVKGSILDFRAAVFEQEGTDDRSKLHIEKPFTQLWAEVYWRNGRVTRVPLTKVGEGVAYEHGENNNSIFNIYFVSEADDFGHIADIIHLKE